MSGIAAWLSCIEADVKIAVTGTAIFILERHQSVDTYLYSEAAKELALYKSCSY